MDSKPWTEKVVLVTGANSGIGKCLTECLVGKGMTVVGIARRIDKIKMLADELKSKPGKLVPAQCDLTNQAEIQRTLEWIEKNLGAVDILINNAAVNIDLKVQSGDMEDWKKTFDVNLFGLTCMTKETLNLMKRKGINNGIIVNINDTCGWKIPVTCNRPVSPAYIASKLALSALTECLRMELMQVKSNIKVMSITPGLVETDMTAQWLKENPSMPLKPKDVADCILFALQTPENVLIKELVVTPIRDTM
ncbi:dehydrogenase/reductase SDR family member 11-like [Colletes gigas]|uniref:dehydrogenase/reductase SDR family member 11-like n=1 Tax=Colletes gigas TaxID=935657 RepID=UPI001C9B30BE|nr:dehydrogenase/reductase SDR family member 11-like [Colletes gigas]